MLDSNANYKTSTGGLFIRVKGPGALGESWQDPDGFIWCNYQGDFSNSPLLPDKNNEVVSSSAMDQCLKIGGQLPSAKDYRRLVSFFEHTPLGPYCSEQGKRDWYFQFPDMQERTFWTRSVVSVHPILTTRFDVDLSVFGVWGRDTQLSVRCIIE